MILDDESFIFNNEDDGNIVNDDDNEYLRAIIGQLRARSTTAFCSRAKHVNSQEPGYGCSFDHVVNILYLLKTQHVIF